MQAKGIAAFSPTSQLGPFEFQRREPRELDVLIDIKFCGICHSDIHNAKNEWESAKYPLVPGHEIAGVVRSVGSKVSKFKAGDHVGVGCFVETCRKCENCQAALDQYCTGGWTLTYNSVEKDTGKVTYGGYSNMIVVDENYVVRIPDSMPLDRAAPLMCAGITLYSPLMHWKAGKGKKVGILGLGGLGHMGVKIAVALGAEVTVFSQSNKKKDDAFAMGVHKYVNASEKEAFVPYQHYFDLIINTVSSHELNMKAYFETLKLDATLVNVGAPEKPLAINPFALILFRRNFAGSLIGSIKETQEMLNFCAEHNILCDIELIAPDQVNVAYDRVLKSDVRYRFVIDMGKL